MGEVIKKCFMWQKENTDSERKSKMQVQKIWRLLAHSVAHAPAMRLRRALPARTRRAECLSTESGDKTRSNMCERFGGRNIRMGAAPRFSIGSASPGEHLKIRRFKPVDGETRCGIKIPEVSLRRLPRAPPHSCPSVYRCHSAVMAAVLSFHA